MNLKRIFILHVIYPTGILLTIIVFIRMRTQEEMNGTDKETPRSCVYKESDDEEEEFLSDEDGTIASSGSGAKLCMSNGF